MGSDDLILALESKGTSVKLVKITEEQVKEIESVLPTTLKPITRTMQIHQIIVPSRGTILHRPLSCFCARPAICQCFKPETFSFPTQREAAHSSSSILQTCEEVAVNTTASTVSKLRHIVEVDESLVSNYCVVKYDGKAYPGLILSVDEEEEIEVKTMHRVGRNRFFWPMMDDVLWYQKENIITILDNPPRPVTKRHVEIEPEIWELVEKEEDE
ncbi:uncharacterized protein LOC134234748 [Saccostrea cucullata]|uniref:uncharacterized protein LOC134234748 n=1 Tax=Saccostrea cuccullata TaxID=36930 RepID=UPI002ED43E13